MAIGDRIKEAIDALKRGDPTNALIQVSIAIDATAKRLHPKLKVGPRYRAFIADEHGFITRMAYGLLEIRGPVIWEWPSDPKGYKTQEEVLYELVRCGLLHDGELPPEIKLTNERVFGMTEAREVLIPNEFIWGMVLAVIACPANRSERLPPGYAAQLDKASYDVNELWGEREYLYKKVRELNAKAAPSA